MIYKTDAVTTSYWPEHSPKQLEKQNQHQCMQLLSLWRSSGGRILAAASAGPVIPQLATITTPHFLNQRHCDLFLKIRSNQISVAGLKMYEENVQVSLRVFTNLPILFLNPDNKTKHWQF